MSKKILYSFCAGAALLGMASCSNDNVDGPSIVTPDNAVGYAKVSINFPTQSGTRGFNGYENGSAEEQAVSSIKLALYDSDGKFVGTGEKVSDDLNASSNGAGSNVSNLFTNVFKLYLNEGEEYPSKVIAFINTDIKPGSLEDLANGVAINVDKETLGAENNFPMTNSGYYTDDNGGEWVIASEFTYDASENGTVFDTQAAAEAASTTLAATIYVERLAAKVTVSKGEVVEDLNYRVEDVNGKDLTLTFNPTNWSVTGFAKQENVVKSVFNKENLFTEYNKAADHRSFWANATNWALGFDSYYDTASKKIAANSPLDYISFADIKAEDSTTGDNVFDLSKLTAIGESEYAPEHTTVLGGEAENLLANTYAIVVGNYTVSGENAAWFQNGDATKFYLLLKGMDGDKKVYTAYTKSQLIGLLLSYNGVNEVYDSFNNKYATKPGAAGYSPTFKFSDYFDIVYGNEGKYVLGAKADASGTLYAEANGQSPIEYSSTWTKTTNSRHYYFPNGGAYFNVPIVHAVNGDDTFYGLVRNHTYKLTINKIENLGAPIDENGHDENDPIVPDIDELKDHFINAQIEILSWHVVENGVTL